MSFFQSRKVLVTGGASFIGSHLVDRLLAAGAFVRVVDDFSSGSKDNLKDVLSDIELREGDLKDASLAEKAMENEEVVFHLAADHGGRGYVDLHQAACATNMGLDQTVISAALASGLDKFVFASSGCVYPNYIQGDLGKELYLTEEMVGPPYDPDGLYGMAKLAGELTLRALHSEHGFSSASCRYFTVYGPRGIENHAVMAMIARAFISEDPFMVWGTGEQIRNWTYVTDIVSGTMRAAENINDGTAINLGTMERVRVLDAVQLVLEMTGHTARIELQPQMPTGPLNRVADNSLARRLLKWEPAYSFKQGLRETIEWYFSKKDREQVRQTLATLLTERPVSLTTPR